MKKLVIFTSDEVEILKDFLSLGTSSFASIGQSSVTPNDIEEIENRNAKKFKKDSPDFDKDEFNKWICKKLKQRVNSAISNNTELILVAETALLSEDYKEILYDIQYNHKYESLVIGVSNTLAESSGKALFFISGKEFTKFAELLTKGSNGSALIISSLDDTTFLNGVLNSNIKLIVVNVSNFSLPDKEFYSRSGKAGGYVNQTIFLPADLAVEPTELPRDVSSANLKKVSGLAKDLKITGYMMEDRNTTVERIVFQAIKKGLLGPDEEYEDDFVKATK